MAIDTTPSQVATNALQAIPFGAIIGGPLNACIEAQALAAQTSWKFIQEVGLSTDANGKKEAVNVTFQFIKDGQMAQLNVPLLTIVPIPYIAITDIDIAFKANISAASSSVTENSESTALDAGLEGTAGAKLGPFHVDASFNANYSSKKDSKATQDSRYSVEYTMDVAVKAGQDNMPAGMAKVLEILSGALSVESALGTLEVNSDSLVLNGGNTVNLIVTYRNPNGVFAPEDIKVSAPDGVEMKPLDDPKGEKSSVFELAKPGDYKVSAGDRKITVKVSGEQSPQSPASAPVEED